MKKDNSNNKPRKINNFFKQLRFKWLSLRKSTKAWIIASSIFIIIALICFFTAIHLCGFSIGEWFAKYYAYFILIFAGLLLIFGAVIFWKYVKGDL